jgi:hypothetical protein
MKDRLLGGGRGGGSKIASRESKNEQDTVSLPEQTQRTIEHRLILLRKTKLEKQRKPKQP